MDASQPWLKDPIVAAPKSAAKDEPWLNDPVVGKAANDDGHWHNTPQENADLNSFLATPTPSGPSPLTAATAAPVAAEQPNDGILSKVWEGAKEGAGNVVTAGKDMLAAGADQAREIWAPPLDQGHAAPDALYSLGTLGRGAGEIGDVAMRAMQTGFQVPAAMLRSEGKTLSEKVAPAAGFPAGATGEVMGAVPEGFIGEGSIPHVAEDARGLPKSEVAVPAIHAPIDPQDVHPGDIESPIPTHVIAAGRKIVREATENPPAVAPSLTIPPAPDAAALGLDTAPEQAGQPAVATTPYIGAPPEPAVTAAAPDASAPTPAQMADVKSLLSQDNTTVTPVQSAPQEPPAPTPAPAPAEPANTGRPAPAEPDYSDAKTRAQTYAKWLDELDGQRRTAAAQSPMAGLLRTTEASILNKVGGVEGRLTNAAAGRLAEVRGALDELLNPVGDSPDMARVRAAMVDQHQKMADAASPPPIPERSPAAEPDRTQPQAAAAEQPHAATAPQPEIAPAQVPPQPVSQDMAVINGNAPPATPSDAVPTLSAPSPTPAGSISPPAAAPPPPTTFTTARGSTYAVHDDGTTTRDKAARADVGHEGQSGPQPRSQATIYVTPEQADALSLIQTKGGAAMALKQRLPGQWGIQYTDGPGAGKYEKRTVIKPQTEPAMGLTPVEVFNGGRTVHFGNEITKVGAREAGGKEITVPPNDTSGLTPKSGSEEITPAGSSGAGIYTAPDEVSAPKPILKTPRAPLAPKDMAAEAPAAPASEPKPRALALKPLEGTGDERNRAINDAAYRAGAERPQKEAAEKLVTEDPEGALAIAMRQKQPPPDVHPEFVYMALESKATREGDTALAERLKQSRIAEEATSMGQRVGAWKNRDPLSAVSHMQTVDNARAAMLEQKTGSAAKAVTAETREITKQVQAAKKQARALTAREKWAQTIAAITCKA